MTAWHHAYNGVPTTRKHQKNGKNGLGGDYTPVRHDHLLPNGLSGELHVSIKVASPTVPGQRTAKGQVVVSSRSGAVSGAMDWEDATIPATTLKGVLSCPPTRRSPHPACASSQATTTCSHTAAHLRKRRFSIPCSSSRIERLPGELVFGHESCSGGIGDPRTASGIAFRACVQPSFLTPRSPVQPCMTNQVS